MTLKDDPSQDAGLAARARGLYPEIGTVVRDRRVILVTLRGELDAGGAPHLTEALEAVIDHEVDRVIFDVARLDYMDSSGLRVLVGVLVRLGEQPGSVVVRHPSATMRRLLDVTGLAAYFAEP